MLPRNNKKTKYFTLPVEVHYLSNKQQVKEIKYQKPRFLKRRIYGYFYNNLRAEKILKLTRTELMEKFKFERLNKAKMFNEMMGENNWNRAELARNLGVSRAWVTIVMNELKN